MKVNVHRSCSSGDDRDRRVRVHRSNVNGNARGQL